MNEDQIAIWHRWAQFRFSVIGEVLSFPPQRGQLQEAIARMAKRTYQHPIDENRCICIGESTIERWYYKAKAAPDPIAVEDFIEKYRNSIAQEAIEQIYAPNQAFCILL